MTFVHLRTHTEYSVVDGSLRIEKAGGLYPSAIGNLSLYADDSIAFTSLSRIDQLLETNADRDDRYFGLIDADPVNLPNPLNQVSARTDEFLAPSLRTGFRYISSSASSLLHARTALHADDDVPARVYALNGDIVGGRLDGNGILRDALVLAPTAGVLAGKMTKTNTLGYVGAFPIPEVLQGINAFTLGMRSVNPKATVKVVWLNAWFDPPKEREAAMALFNQDVDVIAFHTGSTAVMAAAQERGKMAVAYHSDMRKVGPDAQIIAVTHQWGDYYTARVKAAMAGTWTSGSVWGGVKEGMIRVGDFGPKVPKKVQDEIASKQKAVGAGKLLPFAGPITDNEGKAVLPAGQSLSDAQILNMNYLVQGVVGRISR